MLWEFFCLLWGTGWSDWFGTTSWLLLTKNEGGTRSYTLMQLTICLLKRSDRKGIKLVSVHLPGFHDIQADSLSRVGQILTTDWTIAMECLRSGWGVSSRSTCCILCQRTYPDHWAEFTDALSVPMTGMGLFVCFPPFKMIPQVLRKISQSPGIQVILISKLQETAFWFPEFWEMFREDTFLGATKVSHCWLRMMTCPAGGQGLVAASSQIFLSGDYECQVGGERTFPGSRWDDDQVSACLVDTGLLVPFCTLKRWIVFNVRSHRFTSYLIQLF